MGVGVGILFEGRRLSDVLNFDFGSVLFLGIREVLKWLWVWRVVVLAVSGLGYQFAIG